MLKPSLGSITGLHKIRSSTAKFGYSHSCAQQGSPQGFHTSENGKSTKTLTIHLPSDCAILHSQPAQEVLFLSPHENSLKMVNTDC